MKKMFFIATSAILLGGSAIAYASNSNKSETNPCPNTPGCICTPNEECPDMPGCVCSQ